MNRILICSNDVGIRESLKLILEDYDTTICDKKDCLNLLEGNDLLILFLRRGEDLLQKVKEKNPNLKTILIVDYKDTDITGEEDYVVKPFSSKELLSKVAKCLDTKL